MADHPYLAGNALVCGDNIDVLRELPDECADLIYLDPPFNSNQFYVAAFGDKGRVAAQLRDIWEWTVESENTFNRIPNGRLLDTLRGIRLQAGEQSPMAAYCVFMARRLAELRRVLKPKGSIYLHCDWHANAYLRLLMDAIFGDSSFQNEIIWRYRRWPSKQQRFQRMHDVLLTYSKDSQGFGTFNQLYEDLAESTQKTWGTKRQVADFSSGRRKPSQTNIDSKGAPMADVWEIGIIAPIAKERLGYPTQKPLALLERIIKASSNPGDLVLDPFCGCGTAADAAASLGRKYLGIDISGIAVRVMQQRLASRGGAPPAVFKLSWEDYEWRDFERRALAQRYEVEDGIPGYEWAEDRVAALLNAVPNEKKKGDGGVDARYFGAMDIAKHEGIVVPIQVKMHRNPPVGRPDMDRLLGVQTAMQNRGLHAPMSVMVTLYPPSDSIRRFAAGQGQVTLTTREEGEATYPRMQALSVQEMLTRGERPKLPPVDPRSLVGDTQDKMLIL